MRNRYKNSRYYFSAFLVRFETRQYLRERYGFYRIKQLLNLFNKKRYTPTSVLSRLEMRLGSVLVSIGFVPNGSAARQLVTHGFVLVNNKVIRSFNYEVSLGDVISIPSLRGRLIVSKYIRHTISNLLCVRLRKRLRAPSVLKTLRQTRLNRGFLTLKRPLLRLKKSGIRFGSRRFIKKRNSNNAAVFSNKLSSITKPFFKGLQILKLRYSLPYCFLGNRFKKRAKIRQYRLFMRPSLQPKIVKKEGLRINDWYKKNVISVKNTIVGNKTSFYKRLFAGFVVNQHLSSHKKLDVYAWKEWMIAIKKFHIYFYRSRDVLQTYLFLGLLGVKYTFDSSAFGYFMKLVNFTKQQLASKNFSLTKKDFISALLPQVSTIASKRSIAFKKFGAKRKLLLVNRYKNYSETNNVLHEKILVRVFVGRVLRRFVCRVPKLLNVLEDSLSEQPKKTKLLMNKLKDVKNLKTHIVRTKPYWDVKWKYAQLRPKYRFRRFKNKRFLNYNKKSARFFSTSLPHRNHNSKSQWQVNNKAQGVKGKWANKNNKFGRRFIKKNYRRFAKTRLEFKVKKVISLQLPSSHFEIDALNLSAMIIKAPCSNRWFLTFPQKIPLRGLHTIIKSKL
jgi:ribosomal protein S4